MWLIPLHFQQLHVHVTDQAQILYSNVSIHIIITIRILAELEINNGAGGEEDVGGNGEGRNAIIPDRPNDNPNGPNDDANQENDGQRNRGQ